MNKSDREALKEAILNDTWDRCLDAGMSEVKAQEVVDEVEAALDQVLK